VQDVMTRFDLKQLSRDESGNMFVAGAAALVLFAAIVVMILEGGRYLQLRRHLQTRTDAAALAAGQALNACFNIGTGFVNETAADNFIEATANSYGGVDYNKQFSSGTTGYVFQSNSFAAPVGNPPLGHECFKDSNPANTDPSNLNLMVDVKGTQRGIGKFFFRGSGLATAHAWARVQLQVIKALRPAMPLAIPDVNPKHVAVTFVDNSTGSALTGCTTPTLGSCTYALTGPTSSGILNAWSGSPSFTMPAANTNVGMRVSVGPANGDCSGTTTATATFTCYDYGAKTGILAIRSFSTSAVGGSGTPALLREVTPTTCLQGNIAGGTPYFSTYQTAANGNCDRVGVTANVDFPAGVSNPNVKVAIAQGGCPNGNGGYTNMNPPASGNTWASNLITLPAGNGKYDVCLSWSYAGGNSGDFNGRNPVQEIFSASDGTDPSRPGGPIMSAGLTGGSNPYSFSAGSTASFNVMIGLTGGVHINPKCDIATSGSGKNYSCATDPTILLRTANTSGSLNYAIDCGQIPGNTGGNLYQMMRYGCANSFSLNTNDICPDTPVPTPTDCAPVMTGDKTGQVKQALNDRLAVGPSGCTPNNYPNTTNSGNPSTDPRIVMLVDTDFSAYLGNQGGSSGSDVPVVNFATFYITGWDGATNACTNVNEPPPPNSDSKGNSSNLWGHFIAFETNGDPSGIKCPGNSVTPCVPALVR
jgi:Flp pilus assembly protein TadG